MLNVIGDIFAAIFMGILALGILCLVIAFVGLLFYFLIKVPEYLGDIADILEDKRRYDELEIERAELRDEVKKRKADYEVLYKRVKELIEERDKLKEDYDTVSAYAYGFEPERKENNEPYPGSRLEQAIEDDKQEDIILTKEEVHELKMAGFLAKDEEEEPKNLLPYEEA